MDDTLPTTEPDERRDGGKPLTTEDGDYDFDDSDWTREELNALGWELAVRNGWEDDDEPNGATP